MKELRLNDIAAVLGLPGKYGETSVCDICTDTRKITDGCAFLALKGERFDGNDFAKAATEAGAAAVIVSRDTGVATQLIVDDTRRAYMDIAAWYKSLFILPSVAVTGSVGKTTTRDMIAAALSVSYSVHKNHGNRNNEIGLPETLLTIDGSYDIGVYEMGMNHFGEISALSKMVAPDAAVISNVGVSHIENLGSRENILKAKLEILDGMEDGAPLILNIDNDLLAGVKYDNLITCGFSEKAMYRAVSFETQGEKTSVTVRTPSDEFEFILPSVGEHNVSNALEALAAAELFGIKARDAAAGLSRFSPTGMRQNIRRAGRITVIEDCYNASPDSMRAGLNTLSQIAGSGRKIAVLGDMLELGDYSVKAHSDVGAAAAQCGLDILLCFGDAARHIAEAAKDKNVSEVYFFDDKSALSAKLCDIISEGDTVLFKGSRGMKLEEIMNALYAHLGV